MVATLLMLLLYSIFAYELDRSDLPKLIGLVFGLFVFSYLLIERFALSFKTLFVIGILARLVFLIALPNLSQDFYRFIWDGRLFLAGLNPYDYTVFEILTEQYVSNFQEPIEIAQSQLLYQGMGELNASNFSNYPPVNQMLFTLSAWIGGKSITATVVVMRLLLILADIGILFVGKQILEKLNLDPKTIFWYFLNPFIIIELTGNLHFEGAMLFFMLAGILLLLNKHYVVAGLFVGISISVKLIPLMLLPLFFRHFVPKWRLDKGWIRLGEFYLASLVAVAATFLPFISLDFLDNFSKSIGLWFQSFEFNASIYYIIRWIGYETIGWNIIADVGRVLPLIIIGVLVLLGLFRKIKSTVDLFSGLLLAISFYFLLSTTVHPWYIATPLLFSLFTRYRFALVWSGMVFFSYHAYGAEGFSENLWIVGLEYLVVLGVFVWDLKRIGFTTSLDKTLLSP